MHDSSSVVGTDNGIVLFIRKDIAIGPYPFIAGKEECHLIRGTPFFHSVTERHIAQEALISNKVLAQSLNGSFDFALRYLELCLYVFARIEQKSSTQKHIVGIQAIPLRLAIQREPVIFYTVKTTETSSETPGKTLAVYTVYHIDARLPILGSRYQDQILAGRILSVTHKDALVSRGWKRVEFLFSNKNTITLNGSNLYPIAFQFTACKGGTSHLVVCYKGVALFKCYLIIAVQQFNTLYLSVGSRHNNLSPDTAHLLHEHLKKHSNLSCRHFINGKVRKSLLIDPKLEALAGEAIHKFCTTQKLAHNQRKQLGITLTIDCSASSPLFIVTKADTLLKGYSLFGTVWLDFAQELLLATTSRK